MIKLCLFDLDGTVADTNALIFDSFRHTFTHYGLENVTDEEIYSFFGEPLFKSMERYAGVEDAPNFVQVYREYNELKHDDMILSFPNVDEVLTELKKLGIKLGIVTSKRSEMAMRSIERLGLTKYFDLIVTPEDTVRHKPEKDPVEFAVNHFGLKPSETIMVGDSPYDLMSGKAAGTFTCGVTYTKIAVQKLLDVEPTFMIDNLKELISAIKTLGLGDFPQNNTLI